MTFDGGVPLPFGGGMELGEKVLISLSSSFPPQEPDDEGALLMQPVVSPRDTEQGEERWRADREENQKIPSHHLHC